jgi:hypothetical protein
MNDTVPPARRLAISVIGPYSPGAKNAIMPNKPNSGAGRPGSKDLIAQNKANLERPGLRLTSFYATVYARKDELCRCENKPNLPGLDRSRVASFIGRVDSLGNSE